MNKLQVYYNKTLKLSNACIRKIENDDFQNLEKITYQMDNYIKAKGAIPIGPLIQRTSVLITGVDEIDMEIALIRQTNNYIANLEPPYVMESVIRCKNCLFVRFIGQEYQLKFAYDKLNLISFEEDISLTGNVYTIFTSQNEEIINADIFMEKELSQP